MKCTLLVLLCSFAVAGCCKTRHVHPVETMRQLPDVEQWSQIRKGMTYEEVVTVLGKPHNVREVDERIRKGGRTAITVDYGSPIDPSDIWPKPPRFRLWLDADNHTVFSSEWPFGPKAKIDALPSVPEVIIPLHESKFDHYPRYLDFRWFPAAGVGKITYEIEHQIRLSGGSNPWREELHQTQACHFVLMHSGSNLGRIRIRAHDENGAGDWSRWVNFEFQR